MEKSEEYTNIILEKLNVLLKMMMAQLEYDNQHLIFPACNHRIQMKIHQENMAYLQTIILLIDRVGPKLVSKDAWDEINGFFQAYLKYGQESGSMKEVKRHVIRRDGEIPEIEFADGIFGDKKDDEKPVI